MSSHPIHGEPIQPVFNRFSMAGAVTWHHKISNADANHWSPSPSYSLLLIVGDRFLKTANNKMNPRKVIPVGRWLRQPHRWFLCLYCSVLAYPWKVDPKGRVSNYERNEECEDITIIIQEKLIFVLTS
jgi:hypothetical protein